MTLLVPVFLPSPSQGVWHLGPVPIRAYALCIMAGIVVAWWLSLRRWQARGGSQAVFESILLWAIPAGVVGARLYHVITDYQLYFGPGRSPLRALYMWEGGLGVWGAVALGALAAWWAARRHGASFTAFADAVAPGVVIAQGIGRLGNWFNQELFGRPTTLPWGLQIDVAHRPAGYEQYATFHPTFLYEMVWTILLVAPLLLWADRRFQLGRGKLFALYVVLYCAGRLWIEHLRIDTVNTVGGFRLNEYTSLIVLIAALASLLWLLKHRPGREEVVEAPAATVERESEAVGESADDEASDTAHAEDDPAENAADEADTTSSA